MHNKIEIKPASTAPAESVNQDKNAAGNNNNNNNKDKSAFDFSQSKLPRSLYAITLATQYLSEYAVAMVCDKNSPPFALGGAPIHDKDFFGVYLTSEGVSEANLKSANDALIKLKNDLSQIENQGNPLYLNLSSNNHCLKLIIASDGPADIINTYTDYAKEQGFYEEKPPQRVQLARGKQLENIEPHQLEDVPFMCYTSKDHCFSHFLNAVENPDLGEILLDLTEIIYTELDGNAPISNPIFALN